MQPLFSRSPAIAKPHTQTCSIAEFLNLFGDSWTLLILREAFYGATRFSHIQKNTGIAKNLLSDRLARLVEEEVLERVNVGERGTRYAYHLTEKGRALMPVFAAIIQWSNTWQFGPGKEPILLADRNSGQHFAALAPVGSDGHALQWAELITEPGPGASRATLYRINQSRKDLDER